MSQPQRMQQAAYTAENHRGQKLHSDGETGNFEKYTYGGMSVTVWESAFDIYGYSDTVPEVVGLQKSVVYSGILTTQKERMPAPRCKEVGYTTLEWLSHWTKALKGAVLRESTEEKRQEGVRLVTLYLNRKKLLTDRHAT